jgi:hypothetical protein
MQKLYDIRRVAIANDNLELIIGEKEYKFPLKEISEKLIKANDIERMDFKISPSGYGIHWRLIDEDISIPGLLEITNL